jgi:hypothetical protein
VAPTLQGEAAVEPLAGVATVVPAATIAVVCLLLVAALLVMALLLLLRHRRTKHIAIIKFDNPNFRRPAAQLAAQEERVSSIDLNSGQVSYSGHSNPLHSFGIQNPSPSLMGDVC